MDEFDRIRDTTTLNDREIRRLRVQMDQIAAGGLVRATSIGGVIPAANRPVAWWFNANLLGLGDELELLEGAGVWISGSFVGGRAYYHIGAYCAPPCGGGAGDMTGVDFLVNDAWFCFGRALDLLAGPGIWISGTCDGDEASYRIGAYGLTGVAGGVYEYGSSALSVWGTSGIWQSSTPFIGTVSGNPTSTSVVYNHTSGEGSIMRGMVLHNTTKGERVYVEAINIATNTFTVEANSPDDADTWDNLDNITTASQTNVGRGGTFVDIDVTPFLGGTNAVACYVTGYTARRNADTWFLIAHPYEGYDVDKEINLGKHWADDTFMFRSIIPLTKAGGRHYFTLNLWALAASNASTMGRWVGQFTRDGGADRYTDAEAIAAVEGEPTLALDGAITEIHGDPNFTLSIVATNPRLTVAAGDYLSFNRAGDYYSFFIGSTERVRITATTLAFNIGANPFFYAFTDAGAVVLNMDADDYIWYDRAGNYYAFIIATAEKVRIHGAGLTINGVETLSGVAADPGYVDGKAILYFYSAGGVDELRVRGKVGATETQVTLADITP